MHPERDKHGNATIILFRIYADKGEDVLMLDIGPCSNLSEEVLASYFRSLGEGATVIHIPCGRVPLVAAF
jgi:hypothetical protein